MAKIKTKYILLYFIVLISVGSLGFHLIDGKEWGFVSVHLARDAISGR